MKLVLPTGMERELTEELIVSIFKNQKRKYMDPVNVKYFKSLLKVKDAEIKVTLNDLAAIINHIRTENASWDDNDDSLKMYPPYNEEDISNIYRLMYGIFPDYFDQATVPNIKGLSQFLGEKIQYNFRKLTGDKLIDGNNFYDLDVTILFENAITWNEKNKALEKIKQRLEEIGIPYLTPPSSRFSYIDNQIRISVLSIPELNRQLLKLGYEPYAIQSHLEKKPTCKIKMEQGVQSPIYDDESPLSPPPDLSFLFKKLFPAENKKERTEIIKYAVMKIKKNNEIISLPDFMFQEITLRYQFQDPFARIKTLYKKAKITDEHITFENLHYVREKIQHEKIEILQMDRYTEQTGRTFFRPQEIFSYEDDQFISYCMSVFYPEKFFNTLPDEKKLSTVLGINCSVAGSLLSKYDDFQISLDFVKYNKFVREQLVELGALIINSDFDLFNKNKVHIIIARYGFKDLNNAIEKEYQARMSKRNQDEGSQIEKAPLPKVAKKVEAMSSCPLISFIPQKKEGKLFQHSNATLFRTSKGISEPLKKDIKDMFSHLIEFKFSDMHDVSVVCGDDYRTTRAHYIDSSYGCCGKENVCRTTITSPDFNCSYIEYRETPYQDLGGEQEVAGKESWSIAFSSKEKASEFLKLLYLDQRIIALQKIRETDFYWLAEKKIAHIENNVVHVNDGVKEILDILCTSKNCPKEAIQEQLKLFEIRNFSASSRLVI